MYVRPNGEIQPCVFWYGEEPVGDLSETDFATTWKDPEYAALREEVARGVFTRRCCRTCPAQGCGSVDDDGSFAAKTLNASDAAS
jgi:radical SAM protein with 4Fe4S-binding SPASM domain